MLRRAAVELLRNAAPGTTPEARLTLALALLEVDAAAGDVWSAIACGLTHFALGHAEQAEASLGQALTRVPESLDAAQARGLDDRECEARRRVLGIAHYRLAFLLDLKPRPSTPGEQAARHLEVAAKLGVVEAQLLLGQMLLRQEQEELGWRWITAAAHQGLAPAQRVLGNLQLERGLSRQGFEWLTRAGHQGDGESWQALCKVVSTDSLLVSDVESVRTLRARAAAHGDPASLMWLGQRCIAVGCCCTRKRLFFQSAAKQGHVEANVRYALALLLDSSSPQAAGEATKALRRAAEAGSPSWWVQQARLLFGVVLCVATDSN